MDKGLTFLTLSLVFLWLVFDDFVGKKRLSNLSKMMTPDFTMPSLGDIATGAKEEVEKNIKENNEAAKGAQEKLHDTLTKPSFTVSGKTQETLDKLREAEKKRKETGTYKDKGSWGYSWEDLFKTVKGWFS